MVTTNREKVQAATQRPAQPGGQQRRNGGDKSPMVKLTGLWRQEDKNGKPYYSGVCGGVRYLAFRNTFQTNDQEPYFNLYLAENRPADRQPQAGDAPAAPPPDED